MKTFFNTIKIIAVVCLISGNGYSQVGMSNNNPDKSAVLDMKANSNKGLLIPNVNLSSTTDKEVIAGGIPAQSLLVYNTNASISGTNAAGTGYYYWDLNIWKKMLNTGDTAGSGDDLGNHTATMDLNMASNNIVSANKTTTKTAQIQEGTDGIVPVPGSIATAADASGNIVWKSPDVEGIATAKLVGYAKVSISRATGSNVFFDRNILNPESAFTGDYNTGTTYTIQKNGLHQIFVNLTAYTAATTWYLRIKKNGTPIAAIDANTASGASAVVFAIDEFVTGDKISVDMGGTVKGYQQELTKISIFRFEK